VPAPKERIFSLTTEYITLGQLLKAADVVSSGAEGKMLIEEGRIKVNGEPDDRRGRKLRPGDKVTLPDGRSIRIQA